MINVQRQDSKINMTISSRHKDIKIMNSLKGSLTIQKRLQTGEKFTQSNNLTKKKRVHTGEKPYISL